MKTTKNLRRIGTSAAAAATVLALAAPSAGAAAGAPDIFAGTSEALALDLRVKAPAELLGALSSLTNGAVGANEIVQKVSITQAGLSSDGVLGVSAQLLDGLIPSASNAYTAGKTSGEQAIAAQDFGVVSVGVGTTKYVADAATNVTSSATELAHLNVSLAPLFGASSPVPAAVQDALTSTVAQVTSTINGVVGELNGVLTMVEDEVEGSIGAVIDIPQVLPSQLPTVPDITKVSLVEIRKIWSLSEVTANTGVVRSVANSGIAEASILGGLIEVPAFQYTTWAETAGTPGSAKAGGEVTTIKVKVGDTEVGVSGNVLSVGDFTLDISDPTLAGIGLGDELSAVTDLLGEILNAVGISVSQGTLETFEAPDGSSASAATSAFALNVAPLNAVGAADTLAISLNLLPTRSAVSAAPAPVNPIPAPDANTPRLPRTGGGTAVMILGTLAMGGAGFLRRRF